MIILGIDPGLQVCGYAAVKMVQGKEVLIEAGVLRSDRSLDLPQRLVQIGEDFRSLMSKFKPDVVAVEKLYSHYNHPQTAVLMGHARGVIIEAASREGAVVKSFAATRIKKSLTGNGRASKGQMQRSIQSLLKLEAVPEPPDVADAIAAALCCANEGMQGEYDSVYQFKSE